MKHIFFFVKNLEGDSKVIYRSTKYKAEQSNRDCKVQMCKYPILKNLQNRMD